MERFHLRRRIDRRCRKSPPRKESLMSQRFQSMMSPPSLVKIVSILTLAAVLTAPPGALAGAVHFIRGDANANGRVDLSDAVFTLAYLFQGGDGPSCNDAADSNDSGKVDLSDAVYTLGYLFLGGPAPPAPGLECGWDPTPDDIYCFSYAACLQPSQSFDVIDGFAIIEGDIIIGRPEE